MYLSLMHIHPSPNEDISTYYNMTHNVMRDMSGDVYYLSGHYVLGRIFRDICYSYNSTDLF